MKKNTIIRAILLIIVVLSSLLIMSASKPFLEIQCIDILKVIFIDSKDLKNLGISNVSPYVFFFFCYISTIFSETISHNHDTRLFESMYLHKIDTSTFIRIEIKRIVKRLMKPIVELYLLVLILSFISLYINKSFFNFAFIIYTIKVFLIISFFSLAYQLFVNKISGNKAFLILMIPYMFVIVDVFFITSIITFSNSTFVELMAVMIQGILYTSLIMVFRNKIRKLTIY